MVSMREAPLVDAKPASPRRRWWRFLAYPVLLILLIALATAVPQWISYAEAWKEGLSVAQLEAGRRQSELWQKNQSCANAPDRFFVTPNNVKVDATICKSGDIVVQVIPPNDNGRYYWVDLEKLSSRVVLAKLLSLDAYAGEAPKATVLAQASFIMCQRFLDQRMLLRVLNEGGSCVDEVVDTYTGIVQSRNASQCRSSC